MDSSFVLFNDHNITTHTSNVQLDPMGTGPSEELVLQADDGGHGEVHLASGASPALWRISGAVLVHICHISGILAHLWHSSGASHALWRISGAALVHISGASPALW